MSKSTVIPQNQPGDAPVAPPSDPVDKKADKKDNDSDNDLDFYIPRTLEESVHYEIKMLHEQIGSLKKQFFANPVIPGRHKKILQNIMQRCTVDSDCLLKTNFSERRQADLRMKVKQKLDMMKHEVEKLRKLTHEVNVMNKGNKDHVCKDKRNFYLLVG